MLCLEDKTKIRARREEVAAWFRNLPQHYKEWHPKDHLAFDVLSGEDELHEGSVARAAERLGSFTLLFTFKITRVKADRELEWRATLPYRLINLHGKFMLEERDGTTEVTATACYGWPVPLLGRCLDWIVESFFLKKALITKHMREEGKYMRAAIEAEARRKS